MYSAILSIDILYLSALISQGDMSLSVIMCLGTIIVTGCGAWIQMKGLKILLISPMFVHVLV